MSQITPPSPDIAAGPDCLIAAGGMLFDDDAALRDAFFPGAAYTLPIPPAPPALVNALIGASCVLVCAHQRPDGDAAGSAVGLARLLRARGTKAWCVGLDPLPAGMSYLLEPADDDQPDASPLALDAPPSPLPPGAVVAALDCAASDRLPAAIQALDGALPLYVIDHHASNPGYGLINWIAPGASSTGEMVATLAFQFGWQVPAAAADALWLAIVADTGRFGHENTRPSSMILGGYLLASGASPVRAADHLYRSVTMPALKLAGRMIAAVRTGAGGRLSWGCLTRRDFAAVGAGPAEAQELVDYPRSLAGVEIGLFFCELGRDRASGQVKVSVRTRPPYDAVELARSFGGGGHVRAAGFSLPGVTLAAARRQVFARIKELYGLEA